MILSQQCKINTLIGTNYIASQIFINLTSAMELSLVILLLPFAFVRTSNSDNKICVNHQDGSSCSAHISHLEELTHHSMSVVNTVISVNSTNLFAQVKFDRLVNLSIEGVEGKIPTVTCRSNDSGLYFSGIRGLTIKNLAFVGCGALHNSTTTDLLSSGRNKTAKFKSTLYVWKSTNIRITNVDIHNGNGLGLTIFDTNGTVVISNSTFKHNQMQTLDDTTYLGGGGVYIEFTACPPGVLYGRCETSHDYKSSSQYRIEDCEFESNKASTLHPEKSSFVKLVGVKNLTNFQGLGRGGGLSINILGSASENSISILDCKLYNNQAISGGGISIRITGQANNNSVEMVGCEIVNNTSSQNGGGVNIAYRLSLIERNKALFNSCLIEKNNAKSGGGTLLLLNNLGKYSSGQNLVEFIDCNWISNRAEYGAAVDGIVYAPEGLGNNIIRFKTCNFSENNVIEIQRDIGLGLQTLSGRGTFKVTNMAVTFCQSAHFEGNTGTALWAVASKIHFSCAMNGTFLHNIGTNGGAIGLVSNSVLYVHDNTALRFVENIASSRGGALFSHSVHENSFLLSASTCPVQYKGDTSIELRNVTFSFHRNIATLGSRSDANSGNSIYMTSLHSCVFFCTLNTSAELTVDNYFSCIGETDFQRCDNCTRDVEVATQGHTFTVYGNTTSILYAIPGRVLELPIMVLDDLNNAIDSVYRAQIINTEDIVIDPAYDYISNRKVKLYGPSQKNGTMLIELAGLYEISLTVKLKLQECPPGYYIEYKQIQMSVEQKTVEHCTCVWNHSSISAYKGVVCNQEASTAYVLHGYWAGYIIQKASPQHFYTAYCPLHFCSYNNSNFKPFYALPDQASFEKVDEYMCGPARTGILCGRCTHGYSVFYHSKQFECKPNRLCKLGWLFYILSELCPLTLMFIAIIIFNISFTSGALNGFIFFAQVIDSLALNAYDISGIYSPQMASILMELYEFIYRIFNLEFFNINSLSFCLWKGATTLDMLTFKLVSILYALILIVVTIFIIKKCNYRVQCLKRSMMQSYIIHGLAAFLISCYVQCAQISFRILNPIYLEGVGSPWNEKLVQYSGNIEYFSLEHLPYAISALIVITTVIALPPLFLVWYPAGRKLLSTCGLSELKIVQLVEKILMIDRMKPLLDSFQSSFKDNYRFFAGLYFLYRVSALTTFTLARTLPQFYIAVEIELVIIIAFHAAVQPYQKTWHNIVDTFIFSDLVIINALSMYIYMKSTDLDQKVQQSISIAIIIRLLLIYLPLIYIVSYLTTLSANKLRKKIKWRNFSNESTVMDDEFPARMLDTNEYVPFD